MGKYLNQSGLSHFWEKLKDKIPEIIDTENEPLYLAIEELVETTDNLSSELIGKVGTTSFNDLADVVETNRTNIKGLDDRVTNLENSSSGGSDPSTEDLKTEVTCNHSIEITGDTGDEHNLAIKDQQMILKKIEGQSIVINNKLISSNCNLISTGRNLWDEKVKVGYYLDGTTGAEVASSSAMCSANFCPIIPGKTYYFSSPSNVDAIPVYYYDKNKNYLGRTYERNSSITSTELPSNTAYFRLSFPTGTKGYGLVYKNDVCLNVDDSDFNGSYEPYKKSTMVIGEELKLWDYINNVNNTKVKQSSKLVTLNGSESWSLGSTYTATGATSTTLYRFDLTYNVSDYDKTEYRGTVITNGLPWNHDSTFKEISESQITINTSGTKIYVLITASDMSLYGIDSSDITTFKSWLEENNIQFIYKLATPIVSDITLAEGMPVYKGGLQIQNGEVPYILTKEYSLNMQSQILQNVEIDREQQELINNLANDLSRDQEHIQNLESIVSDLADITNSLDQDVAILTTSSTLFKIIARPTMSANGYIDLSSYMSQYNELMIVFRIVPSAATTIGISNTTSGSSEFLCSTSVSGTTYVKIVMNKTDEGNYAWEVGSSFGWSTSTGYKYLRNYTTGSSATISVVIHGR